MKYAIGLLAGAFLLVAGFGTGFAFAAMRNVIGISGVSRNAPPVPPVDTPSTTPKSN